MATGRQIPPVLGKPAEVFHGTWVRLQDTVKKAITEQAAEYVDYNLMEQWIDVFELTAAGYELTSCECIIPTIGGYGRASGKADKCPSWKGHLTEHWHGMLPIRSL